eukprot:SAG31_NODE_4961_length_2834_cov_1.793784_1_plen_42_part_10
MGLARGALNLAGVTVLLGITMLTFPAVAGPHDGGWAARHHQA